MGAKNPAPAFAESHKEPAGLWCAQNSGGPEETGGVASRSWGWALGCNAPFLLAQFHFMLYSKHVLINGAPGKGGGSERGDLRREMALSPSGTLSTPGLPEGL